MRSRKISGYQVAQNGHREDASPAHARSGRRSALRETKPT
jgi:hypothetical protein